MLDNANLAFRATVIGDERYADDYTVI